MLTYKGYIADVNFDADDKVFYGHVLNTRDLITFESTDAKKLEKEFQTSIDGYLEWCAEEGREPEKPFPGKVLIRLGTELHRDVFTAAAYKNTSVSGFIVDAVSEAVASKNILREIKVVRKSRASKLQLKAASKRKR